MEASRVLETTKLLENKLVSIMSGEFIEIRPFRLDSNELSYPIGHQKPNWMSERLNHLLWMSQEIPNLLRDERLEKAMRWLGFIQGSLWALDLMTIAEAKNQNRPN